MSLVAAEPIFLHARLEQLAQAVDVGFAAGGADDVATDGRGRSPRRWRTIRSAPFRASASCSISSHRMSRSSSRSATRNAATTWPSERAFFLGQVISDTWAKPVDQPVGDLGAEDFVAQAVGADRRRMSLAHRCREGVEQLRRDRPCRRPVEAPRRRPAGRASTPTAGPQARAGSGRACPGLGEAVPRSSEALDAAVEAAAGFEQFERPDMAREARSAPPASAIDSASVCRRLSSSTRSDTSSVIRASSAVALGEASICPRASRG